MSSYLFLLGALLFLGSFVVILTSIWNSKKRWLTVLVAIVAYFVTSGLAYLIYWNSTSHGALIFLAWGGIAAATSWHSRWTLRKALPPPDADVPSLPKEP
jgi:hypothetical protein